MSPLLIGGNEGAVVAGCDVVLIEEFAGKFHRHLIGAIATRGSSDHAAAHGLGHGVFHGPEIKPDVVPTEIAQATERLEVTVHADVAGDKIVAAIKAERRMNAAHLADAAVGQCLAQRIQPFAMHEHHAVHELHAGLVASGELHLSLGHIDAARLLAHHMFAGLRGLDHPFRPYTGGQRNIHGVNVVACEQSVVAFHRLGSIGR